MPLTQAHPALAIPLRRLGLPLSALIVGSMAPDFAKFATMSPINNFGHTIGGIFWFCIPSGLLVLLLFHRLLKGPLLTLLPRSHEQRLAGWLEFSFGPMRRFLLIVCGLVAGAATHMLWDSFTHYDGLAASIFPQLTATAFHIRSSPVRIYSLLQHTSTLAGFGFLLFWYFRWYCSTPLSSRNTPLEFSGKTKLAFWMLFIVVAMLLGALYGFLHARHFLPMQVMAFKVFAGRSFVGAMFVFSANLLLFSVIWHFVARAKKAKEHSSVTNLSPGTVQSSR